MTREEGHSSALTRIPAGCGVRAGQEGVVKGTYDVQHRRAEILSHPRGEKARVLGE